MQSDPSWRILKEGRVFLQRFDFYIMILITNFKSFLIDLFSCNTFICLHNSNSLKLRSLLSYYKLYSMKIFISLLLFSIVLKQLYSQQCTFPYERCLCNTASPLCKCSYITQNGTLNFLSTYSSHLVLVSGKGCQPCPPACLKCLSETACETCRPEFYIKQNKCYSCPINCKKCSQSLCVECLSGYYLDSKNQCQLCPWQGTLQCTMNQLRLCLPNYFMDNNGAQCIQCDPYCIQCSSTTKCKVCEDGYYLNSNYGCTQCSNACKTCQNSQDNCIQCAALGQFFQNDVCQNCQEGCLNCNSFECITCENGYMKNGDLCKATNHSIQYCASLSLNSNGDLECLECQDGYFMEGDAFNCHFGCSVLCKTCTGAHYGLCSQCNPFFQTTFQNLHCLPNFNTRGGASYQLFYTTANHPSFFEGATIVSRLGDSCLYESVAVGSSVISMRIQNPQAYRLSIWMKVYEMDGQFTEKIPNFQFTFTDTMNNISQEIDSNKLTINSGFQCEARISKISFDILSNISQFNVLTLSAELPTSTIGISQMLVVGYRCGGLKGKTCVQCSSINTCTKCLISTHYLLNEICVTICPSSYLTYEEEKKCYEVCPFGTYSSEVQRKCLKCPVECTGCTTLEQCFACSEGFYLYEANSECVSSCPFRSYPNQFTRQCEQCLFPCLQCISNQECTSCMYGFLDTETLRCLNNCPETFYAQISSKICQACQPPCQTCQYRSSFCETCLSNYTFHENQCFQICPIGYFTSLQFQSCQPCPIQCSQCLSSSQCLSCLVGFHHQDSCLSKCPIGYYGNSILRECLACPAQCSACNTYSQCTACSANFILLQSASTCQKQCSSSYYSNGFICLTCELPCLTCSSASHCNSCFQQFLFEGECFDSDKCPFSTYPLSRTLTCQYCSNGCIQCSNGEYCDKCGDSYMNFKGICFDYCPKGTFKDNEFCSLCPNGCSLCQNANICLQCENQFVLLNGICSGTCPPLTYFSYDENACSVCSDKCVSCQNALKCQKCENQFYLIRESNTSRCNFQCIDTYYPFFGECLPCNSPCDSCVSSIQCKSCIVGFGFLYQGSCLSSCPQGYYFDGQNICQSCNHQCFTCFQQSSLCYSCNEGYFLNLNLTCTPKEECTAGFYASFFQNQCLPCSTLCLECSENPLHCSKCIENYFLSENSTCSERCPDFFYGFSGLCLTCSENCRTCNNYQHCLICFSNFSILHLQNQTLCVEQCPNELYFQDLNICIPCIYPCQTCISKTQCLSCVDKLYYKGECVDSCPYGSKFSEDKLECIDCGQNCVECDQQKCLICENSVLIFGECFSQCPLGTYESYGVCFQCMHGCKNCNDSYSCNQCTEGFLFNGQCLKYCPVDLVPQNNTCVSCHSSCKSCQISPNFCTKCFQSEWLYLGSCLSLCPSGTYPSSQTNFCISCTLPCETCNNAYSCESCIYGYILYGQNDRKQCVRGSSCPNSYFLDIEENYCKVECDDDESSQLIARTCSKVCPTGFVLEEQNLVCLEACPSNNVTKLYIDQTRRCTAQDYNESILPKFSCEPLNLLNVLYIKCQFNFAIRNLEKLTVSNITMEGMKVQKLDHNNESIFWFVVTPLQNMKLVENWFVVELTPGYELFSLGKTGQNSKNQVISRELPVQNTQTSIFLSLFYHYTSTQRQTGLYLMQLANSLALTALIFWVFSVIKNRKSYSLVAVTGMQWLYTLSILPNNQPPNIRQFLQGFKPTLFLFNSDIFVDAFQEEKLWTTDLLNEAVKTINSLDTPFMIGFPVILIPFTAFLLFIIIVFTMKVIELRKVSQDHWAQEIFKKLSILRNRYRFNYTHHFCHLLIIPTTLWFFVQINSPILLELILCFIQLVVITIILCHSLYLSFFTKNSGNRYFLSMSCQNMILCTLAILASDYFYIGTSIFFFVLNISTWRHVFQSEGTNWKINFFIVLDIIRISIVLALAFIQFTIEELQVGQVYSRGWITVFLIFLYCIILEIVAARDFFEEEQNIKKAKDMSKKVNPVNKSLKQDLLKEVENQQRSEENQSSFESFQDIYEEQEQSFFEDEEEIIDSDEQYSEFSSSNRLNSAPRILIKYDK